MATMAKRQRNGRLVFLGFLICTLLAPVAIASPTVAEEGLWFRQRPEMPWVYMVLALPGDEFEYAEKLVLADLLTTVVDEPRLVIRQLESLGGSIQSRATPEGILVIVEGPSALAPLIVKALKTVFVPVRVSNELVARMRNRVWRSQQKLRYAPNWWSKKEYLVVEESTWRGWYAAQSPQGSTFVGHEALQQVTPTKLKIYTVGC